MPASSVFGRLPVVRAGETGTIPYKHLAGLRSRAHRYNRDLARADSSSGAGNGCPMYLVNFKCSFNSCLSHFNTIYYIFTD